MSRLRLLPLCLLAACAPRAPESPTTVFAPAVGVEMAAKGDVPALTLAIALSRGAALDAVVEPLTTAIHAGLRACPMYVTEVRSGAGAAMILSLSRRTLMMAPPPEETDGTRCMAERLGSQTLSTPDELSLKARVRVLVADSESGKTQ